MKLFRMVMRFVVHDDNNTNDPPPPCEKLLNYSGFVDFFLPHKTSFCAPDTRGLHHTTLVAAPSSFTFNGETRKFVRQMNKAGSAPQFPFSLRPAEEGGVMTSFQ